MTPFQLHVRRWEYCDKCELACQRDRIVLARGKVPCDVLFIGEAPGQSEDVVGQPFVGPAGKLLDHLIDRAGWNYGTVTKSFLSGDEKQRPAVRTAFTNLVACFPKHQKATGENEPPDVAVKACAPRLVEFIELADPQLIVAVGVLAAKWLRKLRPAHDCLEIKIVDIVHPAAILRANEAQQGLMKQRVVVQLASALTELIPF